MSLRKRKPQECVRCKQSEFLMEDQDKSTVFCYECGVGMPKKKRQGRSHESRERVKLNRVEPHVLVCKSCKGVDFVEDHSSGDLICVSPECGLVYASGALFFNINTIPMKNPSKPYQRVVHYQQRMTQLLGNDPEVDEASFQLIRESVSNRKDYETFGKRSFSKLLRELGLDPKIATHWIQLRIRLGWEDPLSCFDEQLLLRCHARYVCVSQAFQNTFHLAPGESKKNKIQRKNIITLNFSIPMILRLESESVFRKAAKYFPQQNNSSHLEINNERWRIIVEYCQRNYRVMEDPVRGIMYQFEWNFMPINFSDVIGYFTHFY